MPREDSRESERLLWGGQEPLHWRWVGVGFAAMAGLHAILVFLVFPLLPADASASKIGLGFLPYLVGGLALPLLSRKRSLLNAFYAACLPAMVFPFVTELMRVRSTHPGDMGEAMSRVVWIVVLAPLLVSVLIALLAAWLAERLSLPSAQSDGGEGD